MAMPPLRLSLLGVDSLHNRRRTANENSTSRPTSFHEDAPRNVCPATSNTPQHQHQSRPSKRRVTSYHNPFQTSCSVFNDQPPCYASAARTKHNTIPRYGCSEPLPDYSCTVRAEGKFLLNLESVNPLSHAGEGDWREVYAVLRGTLLSFHRLKDGGPGKLLRSYTLQHAEVGLAADTEYTILVPQIRLAHLIPSSARRRAWQKDPSLFKPVCQNILRLRAETDQILLADSDEGRIFSLIHALSAAIDISQPIDERSEPKQCTVPRRRRRQHRPQSTGDLADPRLLAEQERIFRQLFPRFADTIPGCQPEPEPTVSAEATVSSPPTPGREEEEIDFSMIREETTTSTSRPLSGIDMPRPAMSRTITATTTVTTLYEDMIHATSQTNFSPEGKWQPPHERSAGQVQRYIKRCMPILNADSHRANDIIMNAGRRMRINWRMEVLEDWELLPPAYKAHNFQDKISESEGEAHLTRTTSLSSTDQTSTNNNTLIETEEDQITPPQVETESEHASFLPLTKVVSAAKGAPSEATLRAMASLDPKGRSPEQLARDIHGVVFCY